MIQVIRVLCNFAANIEKWVPGPGATEMNPAIANKKHGIFSAALEHLDSGNVKLC